MCICIYEHVFSQPWRISLFEELHALARRGSYEENEQKAKAYNVISLSSRFFKKRICIYNAQII